MFGGSAERLSDPEQKPNASADEHSHNAKTGRPAQVHRTQFGPNW